MHLFEEEFFADIPSIFPCLHAVSDSSSIRKDLSLSNIVLKLVATV